MGQRSTARSIMFVVIAMGIAFSASGLIVGHLVQSTYATHKKEHTNSNDGNNGGSNVGNNGGSNVGNNGGSNVGNNGGSNDNSPLTAQQTTVAAPGAQQAETNPTCGQTVSGVVSLSANLNCSGDGIIVGGPNTVINMNGFSITGPGKDSSKVGIMAPNVDNVVVHGPGSISNFQAGVLLTGANGFTIDSVILSGNQIGTFMTGAENAQLRQNIIQNNNIGVASHSSKGATIDSNLMSGNQLAGVTFVDTLNSKVAMNNVHGSQNGIFLDGQSSNNAIDANNLQGNVVDLNNANGLPTNINNNQYTENNCETSNPSGLCVGR